MDSSLLSEEEFRAELHLSMIYRCNLGTATEHKSQLISMQSSILSLTLAYNRRQESRKRTSKNIYFPKILTSQCSQGLKPYMKVVSSQSYIKSYTQQVPYKNIQSHFPQGHMGFLSCFGKARASVAVLKRPYRSSTQTENCIREHTHTLHFACFRTHAVQYNPAFYICLYLWSHPKHYKSILSLYQLKFMKS